jgi:hypothetical protein
MSSVCLLEAFKQINNTIKDLNKLFLQYCQPSLRLFAATGREVYVSVRSTIPLKVTTQQSSHVQWLLHIQQASHLCVLCGTENKQRFH